MINDLPYLQDVDGNSNNQPDQWEQWGAEWRDVHVVDADGEVTDVMNLTANDLRRPANYDRLKGLIVDAATSDNVAESDWQNAVEPLDVNRDGSVVPNDVLKIFNKFNRDGASELTGAATDDFYDVNGDGFLNSLDAITIIRHLNDVSTFGSGEPAGEPPESSQSASANELAVPAVAVEAIFAATKADNADDEDDESTLEDS